MTRICLVFGTRPEAIKLGPVAAELVRRGADVVSVNTGQHVELLRGTPAEDDLRDAVSLGLPSDDQPHVWADRAAISVREAFGRLGATLIVVQGDTSSALAGAIAARKAGLGLVHVEAGVRSGVWRDPWPEEMFRTEIDALADRHLAATEHAARNLFLEGIDRAPVTGNTVVSAMQRYAPDARLEAEADPPYVLVTLHRRELRTAPNQRELLTQLMRKFAQQDVGFVWPVHPAMRDAVSSVSCGPNVVLTEPYDYSACLRGLSRARAVLTDSGGLVEEAVTLGVPCAVLRTHNDRPEAEAAGRAKRFDLTPTGIAAAVAWAAAPDIGRAASTVFGDAGAAGRVAGEILAL